MTYPLFFRRKVLDFVENGASKAEAARHFKINPDTVYAWLRRENLEPDKHPLRHRKVDKEALKRHVEEHPDALLRERAEHFGVSINAIWHDLKAMKIVKKKSADT